MKSVDLIHIGQLSLASEVRKFESFKMLMK